MRLLFLWIYSSQMRGIKEGGWMAMEFAGRVDVQLQDTWVMLYDKRLMVTRIAWKIANT
jgi:hypothetical protein